MSAPPPLEVSWGALLLWALGRRTRIRVQGYSMAPTLRPGDHLLVDPGAFVRSGPDVGDLVLVRHPHEPSRRMVKRVAATRGEQVELRGDNPDLSTDSREFGTVDRSLLLGRVVGRFPGS